MSVRGCCALVAILLLSCASAARAQVPLGPEKKASTHVPPAALPANSFETPRGAAMSPDGRFVVAWGSSPLGPGNTYDVAARVFGAGGRPLAMDLRANTYTAARQDNEAVAIADDGGFVVVWSSEGQDGSGLGVFGQRFTAAGTRVGAEFQVNQQTAGDQVQPAVAMAPGGEFVVVWRDTEVMARRFDAAGAPLGGEFQVNTYTTDSVQDPSVAIDGAGNFVVVYSSGWPRVVRGQRFSAGGTPQGLELEITPGVFATQPVVARRRDGPFAVAWVGPLADIAARRFDAAGFPLGAEFPVNASTTGNQTRPGLVLDADGDLVAVWESDAVGGGEHGVFARRFDPSGTGGPELRVDSFAHPTQPAPSLAADQAGNFVVSWYAFVAGYGGPGLYARRYAAGLLGTALSVDAAPGPASNGNGVLEAGETVSVAPSWLNANVATHSFTGAATSFTGPGGATYAIADAAASYGAVAPGTTASCAGTSDCYAVTVTGPRPALHWDATLREEMAPAGLGGLRLWSMHVGETFADVLPSNPFYRFVEALVHHGVTGGCGPAAYCPAGSTTREQMAVFVLVAKEGGYQPPPCTGLLPREFADVPEASPFCPWIEELARRGVVGGCDTANYCPSGAVSREQMAVFALRTLDPALSPPACAAPMFADLPASSPFCRWVEELARRGVVSGCGGGNYCPLQPVTREQMGVYLSLTFGLPLYGP